MTLNDIITVTYMGRLYAQRILNVFHLKCINAGTPAADVYLDLERLANVFGDVAEATVPLGAWIALVSAEFKFDAVRVQRVYPNRTIYFEKAIGVDGGVASQAPETANIAMSVTKRTATVGRKGTGRIQVAGMPANSTGDGIFTPTARNNATAAFEMLEDTVTEPVGGSVWDWGLYHFNGINNFSPIVQITAKESVRTMHRRTVGLGE